MVGIITKRRSIPPVPVRVAAEVVIDSDLPAGLGILDRVGHQVGEHGLQGLAVAVDGREAAGGLHAKLKLAGEGLLGVSLDDGLDQAVHLDGLEALGGEFSHAREVEQVAEHVEGILGALIGAFEKALLIRVDLADVALHDHGEGGDDGGEGPLQLMGHAPHVLDLPALEFDEAVVGKLALGGADGRLLAEFFKLVLALAQPLGDGHREKGGHIQRRGHGRDDEPSDVGVVGALLAEAEDVVVVEETRGLSPGHAGEEEQGQGRLRVGGGHGHERRRDDDVEDVVRDQRVLDAAG